MIRNTFAHPEAGDVLLVRKWDGNAVKVELWPDDGRPLKPRRVRLYPGKSWTYWEGEAHAIGSAATAPQPENDDGT